MAQVKERRLLAAFMAFMLALAGFMAFTVQDAWADEGTVDVTFAVIGPDADGNDAYYVNYTKTTMPANSTAEDLSKKMFDENSLTYDVQDGAYGKYLESIVSPFDGKTYGTAEPEPKHYIYWSFYVNGGYATVGMSGYALQDGDSIIWYYSDGSVGPEKFTKDMYRIYNPNSGEHFYTMSEAEKDNLVSLGWQYENIGWTAPLASTVPVYRLYNANGGEHHYTMNKGERDNLVKIGWTDEGIGWYSDANESVKLFREYNPNAFANNHNYTTSEFEHNHLISLGWRSEDIAWFGVAATK